jgi:hypothetical protein
MSSAADTDTDARDDSVRPLDVTGYAGLDEAPTLEVAPLTDAIAFDVEPRGEEVLVDVETVAPGEVPVRSSGTLSREEARTLRDELADALEGRA